MTSESELRHVARRVTSPETKVMDCGGSPHHDVGVLRQAARYYADLGFVVMVKFVCDHCGKLSLADHCQGEVPSYVDCQECGGVHDLAASGGGLVLGFNGPRELLERISRIVERDHGQPLIPREGEADG